jgi:hypothetical protein
MTDRLVNLPTIASLCLPEQTATKIRRSIAGRIVGRPRFSRIFRSARKLKLKSAPHAL